MVSYADFNEERKDGGTSGEGSRVPTKSVKVLNGELEQGNGQLNICHKVRCTDLPKRRFEPGSS
jgi:hypothetical protein